MKENNEILNDLNKRQKPAVPENFFQHFQDELMAKIAEEESGLGALKKQQKPAIPDDFFNQFSQQLPLNESAVQERPTKVFGLKVIGFISAVAACLLVMFYVLPENGNEVNEIANSETESADEMILSEEEFLAFVDGDDIVNFVLENEDIILEDNKSASTYNEDDLYYYLEEDIEDLYLEEL